MINIKKAAMFGLDARIALVIFGALSVISGAALYSAIQKSKVTAVITEMNEVGKAYDAYYLDTGSELEVTGVYVYLNIEKLISDNKVGWNGPYLLNDKITSTWLNYKDVGELGISEMLNGEWSSNSSNSNWNSSTRCDTGTVGGTCDIWIVYRDMPTDLYISLENEIDNIVDGQNGNVRLVAWSGVENHVYLKYRPK